jgi:pSer/pThr/pTyr-binding forkhead associated (FHA) protein
LPSPILTDDIAHRSETPEEAIALIFRTGRVFLPLHEGDEITLGRVHTSNKIQPKVDLSAFGGASLGTSRLHAAIRRENNQLWIEDTGSSNGTWVNGERLAPFTPCPLSGNCHLMLANLEVQLIFADRTYHKLVA